MPVPRRRDCSPWPGARVAERRALTVSWPAPGHTPAGRRAGPRRPGASGRGPARHRPGPGLQGGRGRPLHGPGARPLSPGRCPRPPAPRAARRHRLLPNLAPPGRRRPAPRPWPGGGRGLSSCSRARRTTSSAFPANQSRPERRNRRSASRPCSWAWSGSPADRYALARRSPARTVHRQPLSASQLLDDHRNRLRGQSGGQQGYRSVIGEGRRVDAEPGVLVLAPVVDPNAAGRSPFT